MRLRNLLFAPGDSPRKIEKALTSAADGVILDLEDSVAPAAKATAREAVAAVLAQGGHTGMIVRVNAIGTEWYLADLAAVVRAGPAAVLLPKCEGPAHLMRLDHHLEALEMAAGLAAGSVAVLALVTETAASLSQMDYAGAPARLAGLCFGAEDLSADLGIMPRRDGRFAAAIAAARAATLIAAAGAGVAAIDTPWPDPRDPEGLAKEASAAAADGFAGKLCIHPAQLETVARLFTPSAEQVSWAERVRAGFADPDAGVFALDGKMIDRPHLKLAERIFASAGISVPARG